MNYSKKSSLDFSFCIITDNSLQACKRIYEIVHSIRKQKIPNYEILIIGGRENKFAGNMDDVRKIDFDESVKIGWITKKKNDVVKLAKYENLVIMHDYFIFHEFWYKGYIKIFEKFNNCDLCLNPVCMQDGRREYTDWVTWDHPRFGRHASLNYNDEIHTKHQYFSGGYFVVKKSFFLENPLNEELTSHQSEDVEWSLRIRDHAKVIFNPFSYNKHNKKHRNQNIDFWNRMVT